MAGKLLTRLEGLCDLVRGHMVTLHPAEKEWKTFVFDGSAKQQIKEFVKCEKLISIGSMAPIANKFFEAIKSHCDECCNEKVRQWFEYGSKEGCAPLLPPRCFAS